jgi:hypothetical protein
MLNFGNKEFRNLQEQVFKNMKDIESIEEGATVLAEFGIKVIGQVDSVEDLPDPATYDGEYGDAFIVGESAPYNYYIFTRAFEGQEVPQWYDLGIFPQPGPQGPQGAIGPVGATPSISANTTVSTLSAGSNATVSVVRTGSDSEPTLTFNFGIPEGAVGVQGPRGPQGIQGIQGPQGIQGVKGDPGTLYEFYGQVNNENALPSPSSVVRNAAYLVGASEPYDVYVIIGDTELEWINLGPVAVIDTDTHVVTNDTTVTSGTLAAGVLAAINEETNVDFCRVGNIYLMKVKDGEYTTIETEGTSLRRYRLVINLSTGVWTLTSGLIDGGDYVTLDSTQTISGGKIFSNGLTTSSIRDTNGVGWLQHSINGKWTEIGTGLADAVRPAADNQTSLGSSTKKFTTLYTGSIQDGTKEVTPTNIVDLNTQQEITAKKTFSQGIAVPNASSITDSNGNPIISGSNSPTAYTGVLVLPTDVILTSWTLARAIKDGNILWLTLCGQIKNNTSGSVSVANVYDVLLPSSIGDKIYKQDGTTISTPGGSNQITLAIGVGGTTNKVFNIGCSAVNTIRVGFSSSQNINAGSSLKVDLRVPLFLDIGQ